MYNVFRISDIKIKRAERKHKYGDRVNSLDEMKF